MSTVNAGWTISGPANLNGGVNINGTPLAAVATAGTYASLTGTPATVTYASLSGTPTLAPVATAGTYASLTGTPAGIPAGIINQFAGNAAPIGYLLCDGTAYSRTTYAALFEAIASTYGGGDGSTTFNVPNFLGIVPAGYTSGDSNFSTLGAAGGADSVTLQITNLPAHSHTVTDSGHTHGITDPGHVHAISVQTNGTGSTNTTHLGAATNTFNTYTPGQYSQPNTTGITVSSSTANITCANTGGGTAFNTLPPFLVVNYIIKT